MYRQRIFYVLLHIILSHILPICKIIYFVYLTILIISNIILVFFFCNINLIIYYCLSDLKKHTQFQACSIYLFVCLTCQDCCFPWKWLINVFRKYTNNILYILHIYVCMYNWNKQTNQPTKQSTNQSTKQLQNWKLFSLIYIWPYVCMYVYAIVKWRKC